MIDLGRYPLHYHLTYDRAYAALSSSSGKQRAWGKRELRRRAKKREMWNYTGTTEWGFASHETKVEYINS